MSILKTTLEQWQLLQAVVELGSYQKAAEKYLRSQSSVSYQLTTLQERLDVQLLRIVGRKAELTDEGKDLLAQARVLLDGMQALEARAEAFRQGERAHIDLVVDSILPKPALFKLLEAFHLRHPQTRIHLIEVLRSESVSQLSKHTGDMYLIHLPESARHAGRLLMQIPFVAVACKGHELLDLPRPLHDRDLARFPLIRMVDRETQRRAGDETSEHWSFTSVDAAVEAVRHGVGYGWLPEPHIRSLLASGELCPLPLQTGRRRSTPIYMVMDAPLEQDPAMATLVRLLNGLSAE
ncbi:LysR family transcriptional regulator [uncultured Pseudodesulfovibrio sp.]|uniref:LysR family transcriptional regulator n=1 Tax=uncultured Pseudodesulfovibrio sp. TaxID=2035858 RepID=UPI0029C6005C|nr:LysR family transcriptional regulator [uncultured Pseudodesulfovibrio sp.]